jgi:hypothetical protein
MRYRRRVRRVFMGGHTDDAAERIFLLTLTAPGERQHFLPNGQPCECTPPGGVDLASWNPTCGRRWSEFVCYLRRAVNCDVQYAVGRECQERGALHLHAVIRCRKDLTRVRGALRRIAVRKCGFGHELDVQPVSSEAAARYVSKYVTEEVGQEGVMPWFRVDRSTGEISERPAYRKWSASRRWGLTMRQVREAQRTWWAQRTGADGGEPAVTAEPAAPLDSSPQHSTASLWEEPPPQV